MDAASENWNFDGPFKKMTFASRNQHRIYWGPLKPLENILLRSPIVPWSFFASRLYHDGFWFPFIGKGRVARIMDSDWGKLFKTY